MVDLSYMTAHPTHQHRTHVPPTVTGQASHLQCLPGIDPAGDGPTDNGVPTHSHVIFHSNGKDSANHRGAVAMM
jgi:hypothetical protein